MTSGRLSGEVSQSASGASRLRSVLLRPLACGAALLLIAGCHTPHGMQSGLPRKHTVKAEEFIVRSDVKLPKGHPLIQDLVQLQDRIAQELQLPMARRQVTLYVFADELRYAKFLQQAYPDLPPRRAYFIGTSEELAVYTFWGERIQEDLRHEATHGVLHAALQTVPLWLDEGLAEYFETTEKRPGFQPEYARKLAELVNSGWEPKMERLEGLSQVHEMAKEEYQESWAWVHFLLHHSDDTRGVLIDYLHALRTDSNPGPLSTRVAAIVPNMNERFVSHATRLSNSGDRLRTASAEQVESDR